jgi:bacillithiol system protein YtxJ
VIKEREFSRQIAERVKVRHESPQILVMRRGVVSTSASHGEITESHLATMLNVA